MRYNTSKDCVNATGEREQAMPELAEVEFVAQQMRTTVIGASIAAVEVAWPGSISHPSPAAFAAALAGRTIEQVDRRAKVLLMYCSGDLVVTVHRRMAGNLELWAPGDPDPPYLRVAFILADGRRIVYTDPRKFGRLALWTRDTVGTALAAYGPEPLAADFTAERLAEILKGRDRVIKPLLLDQSAIAGLGNIYVDESLFQAGIHPRRVAASLTPSEVRRLHAAIIEVLRAGIAHGGTTFGRHRGFFGEAGRNLDHIQVYRRAGQPCVRCGQPVQRIVVAQRGTHLCLHCQPLLAEQA